MMMKPTVILSLCLAPATASAGEARTLLGMSTVELIITLVVPLITFVIILARIDRWIYTLRHKLQQRREARKLPGTSPLVPIKIVNYNEIRSRRVQDCSCSPDPKIVFEGPTQSQKRKLWTVISICPVCEKRVQTYFDVTHAKGHATFHAHPATPITH